MPKTPRKPTATLAELPARAKSDITRKSLFSKTIRGRRPDLRP